MLNTFSDEPSKVSAPPLSTASKQSAQKIMHYASLCQQGSTQEMQWIPQFLKNGEKIVAHVDFPTSRSAGAASLDVTLKDDLILSMRTDPHHRFSDEAKQIIDPFIGQKLTPQVLQALSEKMIAGLRGNPSFLISVPASSNVFIGRKIAQSSEDSQGPSSVPEPKRAWWKWFVD